MQHRAGSPRSHDRQMQRRFGRRRTRASNDPAARLDFHDVTRLQEPLVDTAGRNGESEWIAADDGAEIAARAECPATLVTVTAELRELPGECFERNQAAEPPSSSEAAPRRAGHRGVRAMPCTVSSNPRSLRATVVIGDLQISASGFTRSVISRVTDSSGAKNAFGCPATFHAYATSRHPA